MLNVVFNFFLFLTWSLMMIPQMFTYIQDTLGLRCTDSQYFKYWIAKVWCLIFFIYSFYPCVYDHPCIVHIYRHFSPHRSRIHQIGLDIWVFWCTVGYPGTQPHHKLRETCIPYCLLKLWKRYLCWKRIAHFELTFEWGEFNVFIDMARIKGLFLLLPFLL